MRQEIVTISGLGRCIQAELKADGTVFGRAATCDCVLDDPRISRRHARLYQDPFGRWIIEDMGSHNGVLINGKKVERAPVGPGDRISIGPFVLGFSRDSADVTPLDATIVASTSIVESRGEELVHSRSGDVESLSSRWMKELNSVADRLLGLTDVQEMYQESCRVLTTNKGRTACILRLAKGPEPLGNPDVMAFAGSGEVSETEPANIRLSKSVLEAVRSSSDTVMASNVRLAPQQLDLTAVENDRPRAVVCSPIESSEDAVQALYLEVSASEADTGVLDFAKAMARQIAFTKKAVLAAEELTQRRLLDHQLAMARTIQLGLTPELAGIPSSIDVSLHYEPAMWVGGDYCDVWQVQGRGIAFAVGDVSGKGLPAALTMANLHAALRTAMHFSPGPSEAMSYVNEHLARHLPEGTFVTLILGMFDPDSGKLHYVNAGHILPVIMNRGDVAELGHPVNLPLGLATTGYKSDSAVLAPGAGIVIVTDGITDTCSPSGEVLGVRGLLSVLRQNSIGQSRGIVDAVVGAAGGFRGLHPQQDDATVLALFLRNQTVVTNEKT